MKKLFYFLATLFLLSSCVDEPDADFDISDDTVTTGEAITFTNKSFHDESVKWEFGDGITSTASNPTHSYSNAGTYTVTLTAYSKKEKKHDKISKNVVISTPDPCLNVTCDYGDCVNGACLCYDGYTGVNCSQQITPNSLKITQIVVKQFPITTSTGAGWDLNDGPDLYVYMTDNNFNEIYDSPNYFTNATSPGIYKFTPNPSINLPNPNGEYIIGLFDFDSTSDDDLMWSGSFIPYNSTNNFPDVITYSGNGVEIDIYYSYAW
jgi:PKD repeat protein